MVLSLARHLAKTIKNPFPGLPALEAMIGRKIVDRIGSNESYPFKGHPLTGKNVQALNHFEQKIILY